jgi:selenide,water dikinase
MGAEPSAALAMVMLPQGDAARQEDDLVALLTGACEVLGDAGAALVGGHTGEGAELAFGLSVTGHGPAERLFLRSALREGDALIVTKALGTGVLFNADMQARAPGAAVAAALAAMQVASGAAARILAGHGARAASDITGFGLAGHLIEMLDASGVDVRLVLDALPTLDGALDLLALGLASTLAPANRRAAEGMMGEARGARFELLFDPQTAGGLIAGVGHEHAAACVAALKQAGYADAAIIGAVTARAGARAQIALSL